MVAGIILHGRKERLAAIRKTIEGSAGTTWLRKNCKQTVPYRSDVRIRSFSCSPRTPPLK